MSHYPGSTSRPVSSHSGAASSHLGLVIHITTNTYNPYGFFSNPANGASSNYWVREDGHVEEYVDPDLKAWAQANGNGQYVSVETSGVSGPMTNAQAEAIAELFAWGHQTYGWPLQLSDAPGVGGLGWHGMGGSAWGGHYDCPGDARRSQRSWILDRARQILGGSTPAPAPSGGDTGNLTIGSSGPRVVQVQRVVGVTADGIFGAQTAGAVKSWQAAHGLVADGIVGPQTWAAMTAPVPAPTPVPVPAPAGGLSVDGAFGPSTIAAMQRVLRVSADGQFGVETKKALQRHLGVTADGVVGPNTIRALQRHVGAGADGNWGPDTTRHIQQALNAGRF